jgi:hypothetical protein
MKRNIIFAATLIILSTLASCTQNEGYIGDLFGIWRLEEITDGTTVEECDTIFMAFQADVFQVRRVDYTSYDYTLFTGLYTRTDQLMQCNFLNHNGTDAVTEEQQQQMLHDLASLHIGEISPVFVVEELNKRNMKLEYNGYRYIFVKL